MAEVIQKSVPPVEEPQESKKGWIFIVLVVLILVGIGGYFVWTGKSHEGRSNAPLSGNTTDIRWELTNDGVYQASSTPPSCADPLVLAAPADLSQVESILYPGQYRDGNYKPHGGFRFADGSNTVTVTAPLDASVTDGGRYLVEGEIQYTFDFVNACGIKYRFGHLRTLTPVFAELAEKLPEAQAMDSRTTRFDDPITVKAGDQIATAVGILDAGNAFFDFGVYDMRQQNKASSDAVFQTAHADDTDLAWHAVCWFDLLSPEDQATVRGLPATHPGSESDYCE